MFGFNPKDGLQQLKNDLISSLNDYKSGLLDKISNLNERITAKRAAIEKLKLGHGESEKIDKKVKEISKLGEQMTQISNDIKSIDDAEKAINNIQIEE